MPTGCITCMPRRRTGPLWRKPNRNRPSAVFLDLLGVIIQSAHRKLRQSMDELTYLLDSTTLPLNNLSSGWARFSATLCGAKLHLQQV